MSNCGWVPILAVWILGAGCGGDDGGDDRSRCGEDVCEEGEVCAPGQEICVLSAQLMACEDLSAGDDCAFAGIAGRCDDGICIAFACGDGIVTGSEQCDAGDLAGADCLELGFYAGELACGSQCLYDASECTGYCGDGVINGPESCDSSELDGADCTDYGFGQVEGLGCTAACDYDTSGCSD